LNRDLKVKIQLELHKNMHAACTCAMDCCGLHMDTAYLSTHMPEFASTVIWAMILGILCSLLLLAKWHFLLDVQYLVKVGCWFFHHRNLNETQIISVTCNRQFCTEDLVSIFYQIALKSWAVLRLLKFSVTCKTA